MFKLPFRARLWQRIFTYTLLLVLLSQATPLVLFYLATDGREARRDNMAVFIHDIILANLDGRARADAKMYLDYFNGYGPQLWFELPDGSVLAGTPVAGLTHADRRHLPAIASSRPPVVIYEAEGLAWETGPSEPLGLLVTPVRFADGDAVMCYTYWNGRFPHVEDRFYWGFAALVPIGGLLSLWMARHVTLPLRRLRRELAAINENNPTARVTENGIAEVTDVAEAVNRLTASLTRHIRGMRELMANVSHELRSPLTRMNFAVDFIEDGLNAGSQSEDFSRTTALAHKHLGLLKEELAVMEQLIGSCLLAGKLDLQQHPAELLPLNLSLLCQDICAGHPPSAQSRNIRFDQDIADDLHTLGDALLLRQALTNLLDNALRYTPENGRIILGLSRAETSPSHLRLSIQNSHAPLADQALAHIFEPFYRAKSDDTGAGLGLSLVHKIITLHGGTLQAENAFHDNESMFRITMQLPMLQ